MKLNDNETALIAGVGSQATFSEARRRVILWDEATKGQQGVITINVSQGMGNRLRNTLSVSVGK